MSMTNSPETRERIERIAATALAMHFQKPDPAHEFAISDTVHNALTALCEEMEREKARPKDEWTEEMGDALWWYFPISEPPHVGSPLDDYFPEYVTHFTPLRLPQPPAT